MDNNSKNINKLFIILLNMKNTVTNLKEEKIDEENELSIFNNLTLYTDRVVELINKNIIDYSSK